MYGIKKEELDSDGTIRKSPSTLVFFRERNKPWQGRKGGEGHAKIGEFGKKSVRSSASQNRPVRIPAEN